MTLRSEPEIRHDEPRRGMAAFRPEHWSKRFGGWFLATVGTAIITTVVGLVMTIGWAWRHIGWA